MHMYLVSCRSYGKWDWRHRPWASFEGGEVKAETMAQVLLAARERIDRESKQGPAEKPLVQYLWEKMNAVTVCCREESPHRKAGRRMMTGPMKHVALTGRESEGRIPHYIRRSQKRDYKIHRRC